MELILSRRWRVYSVSVWRTRVVKKESGLLMLRMEMVLCHLVDLVRNWLLSSIIFSNIWSLYNNLSQYDTTPLLWFYWFWLYIKIDSCIPTPSLQIEVFTYVYHLLPYKTQMMMMMIHFSKGRCNHSDVRWRYAEFNDGKT